MAGRELSIRDKVRASTILEVVIAMVIIILVFGIAMMIYTNVLRMSLSVKKIKAQAILQEMILQTEQNKDFSNQSVNIDDFRIDKEIRPFQNDTLLNEIHLSVYDGNQQKITELQKVMIIK